MTRETIERRLAARRITTSCQYRPETVEGDWRIPEGDRSPVEYHVRDHFTNRGRIIQTANLNDAITICKLLNELAK